MSAACRICGNASDNRVHVAREMMFGTRERFHYVECAGCGCLQLRDVPDDLSPYYPASYYSLAAPRARKPSVRRRMQQRVAAARVGGPGEGLSGRLLAPFFPPPPFIDWMARAGVRYDAPVLDVGSGAGRVLHQLAEFGFTRLVGIDPYLEADRAAPDGVVVYRRELSDEKGEYAGVLLDHVLEHLRDPGQALGHVHRVLRPGGCAIVRLPVVDSAAWREYGTDWCQLDAPRHLHLFTRDALSRLAAAAGLRVEAVVCDSTPFQFWGSELLRRDIPLRASAEGERSPRHHFDKPQLRAFRRRAAQLNQKGQGDQACFYLRRD